jgi:putative membrane protein
MPPRSGWFRQIHGLHDGIRRNEMKLSSNRSSGRLFRNGRAVATAAGVALIGLGLSPALGQESPPYYGPQMMWGSGGWYGMIFGPVFMVLVLAGVIALVALLVRWLGSPSYGTQPSHQAHSGRTPIDVLKERFARGEIDKDEFEERRRVLGD